MDSLSDEVISFIHEHHVLSLATIAEDTPFSCSLFYCFLEDEQVFLFASQSHTQHIQNIMKNPKVSASIHHETQEVGEIKGVQIKGKVTPADKLIKVYEEHFTYAKGIKDKNIWKLQLEGLKFTNNAQGFAKKESWKY